jgi:hypothetical protein
MEKNNRRAVSPNFIEDLGVVAAQSFHGRRLNHGTVETRLAVLRSHRQLLRGGERGKPRLYG